MLYETYDRVLWDFNGTLYDDVALCLDSVNLLLAHRGLPKLKNEDAYRAVFCFPVQTYYERIGLPSTGDAFTKIAHEWVEMYRAREKMVLPRRGAENALKQLMLWGIPQGILSATEQRMLEEQIKDVGLGAYFDTILGRSDIYATDKSTIAARYAESHPGERVLMVGDTVHDFETAEAGGFDCILIEGGHQNRETLCTCSCPVVSGFDDLVAYLSSNR